MLLKWVCFIICSSILFAKNCAASQSWVSISSRDVTLLVNQETYAEVVLSGHLDTDVNVTFWIQHQQLIDIDPVSIEFHRNETLPQQNRTLRLMGKAPGHTEVTSKAEPSQSLNVSNIFLRITVANSIPLITLSSIVGWLYFGAWSISFYPQIYSNCARQSVIGLNFDFLSLNLVGFALYSLFNIGLYYNPFIQQEYFNRYPRGLNPVQLNDVFFSTHACLATLITIIQCFLFDRGDQRVSYTARALLAIQICCVLSFAGLAQFHKIHWLDFLYYCSYIKLFITLIKYIPQAFMNYRRKSTSGWSIGNVLLDFTGGWLSIMQMILNAYNYDDWDSIFGDPTKFGLGLFSVMFDVLFFVQHFVLYRGAASEAYVDIAGETITSSATQSTIDSSYSSGTVA